METPRYAISVLHFGKFPDSCDVQCWRAHFKTEVWVFTMSWINDVEMTKSMDDLMTSQSIEGRRDFPDFEMLDARIASKGESVLQSSELKNKIDSWEEDKLLTWSMITFKQRELLMQLKTYQICALFSCLQNDDVQDFDTRWDHVLLGTSELLHVRVLKG